MERKLYKVDHDTLRATNIDHQNLGIILPACFHTNSHFYILLPLLNRPRYFCQVLADNAVK